MIVAAFAFVSASPVPVDEAVLTDNVQNIHPTDDEEILKLLLIKKLLLTKALFLG